VKFADLYCKKYFYIRAEKYLDARALKSSEKLAVHGAAKVNKAIATAKENLAECLSRKSRLCP
jgi:hypothetical protein